MVYEEIETQNNQDFRMNIKKLIKNLFNPSYWRFDWEQYRETYSYDLEFNASFRGIPVMTKKELAMPQYKYLKLYRKTQAAENTIWYRFLYKRLVKMSYATNIGLYENMHLPKGLIIGHAGDIVVNGNATFEGNIMITHGVTIGRDIRGKRAGSPHFGRDVVVRCYSTVVGNINIGDDVLIAPNTFVNFDVPSHSVVIGNPAIIHHREHATEGHIGIVKK